MADMQDVIDKLTNEGELLRNKGAHSIKSVKEFFSSNQETPAEKKQAAEDARNAAAAGNTLLQEIAASITGIAGDASAGKAEAKKSGKLGGLLGGIGGALGGLGIGAGVAMGGLGALFAGGGYLLKQLAEFDGKAVVANVKELFKIAELTDGIGDAFVKGGSFLISMVGIGLGLAVFGAGAAIASAGGALAKFTDPKWAQGIVDNVVILLGISKVLGGSAELLKKGGAFFLAMTGIGLGLAVFGIGSAVAGLAGALTNFIDTTWAQGIVDNVVILLSLSEKLGGADKLKKDGGAFFLAMTGIGAGLAVFGAGAALTGLAQFIVKDDWATRVKNSVVTLLSIKDSLGSNYDLLKSGVAFAPAMLGVAAGLAVFSLGAAATGLAQFIVKEDWATRVKNSVVTLLSIKDALGSNWDMLKSSGAFALSMTGIGAGLAVFGAGSALAGLSQFISNEDWAQKIKDSVTTLMGIADLSFGDVAKFTIFMTGIAAGLVAFAVGKGANAMGDVIGKFTGNFADNIKKDVTTLMSIIADPNMSQTKANEFSSVMGTIAAGLVKFSGGKFVGALAGAAAGVLSFLSGTKSPMTQMQEVAAKADELQKGADAIGNIVKNLDSISSLKFDGSNLNIKDFAKDLMDSVPAIESAIMGGKIKGGIFSSDIKYKGLASTDIKWDEAAKNLRVIHMALNNGQPAAVPAPARAPAAVGDNTAMTAKLMESINLLTSQIAAMPVGGNIDARTINRGGDQHTSTGQGAPLIPKQTVANGMSPGFS